MYIRTIGNVENILKSKVNLKILECKQIETHQLFFYNKTSQPKVSYKQIDHIYERRFPIQNLSLYIRLSFFSNLLKKCYNGNSFRQPCLTSLSFVCNNNLRDKIRKFKIWFMLIRLWRPFPEQFRTTQAFAIPHELRSVFENIKLGYA